ncbi:hypothetical protein BBK14_25760 [Parafrankia soli]|uniref:HTH-type transcriptional repressor KstR2 C-terminal domain-containing protein n=1 Tax=Parafrankia soli TaxID=2599596 RepID=A0A1S1PLP8_9ACTN|nr:hypothetical protein [Parafrankia soli]OHV22181.1 hypothetical protein BBK14_25760 [Parafrankia soli]
MLYRAHGHGCFRDLIEAGMRAGLFEMASARLASYAILDLGMGVAVWFREDGELTEDAVVWQYSEPFPVTSRHAPRLVAVGDERAVRRGW